MKKAVVRNYCFVCITKPAIAPHLTMTVIPLFAACPATARAIALKLRRPILSPYFTGNCIPPYGYSYKNAPLPCFYIIILPLLIVCVNSKNIIFLLHSLFKLCKFLRPVNTVFSAFYHACAEIGKIWI